MPVYERNNIKKNVAGVNIMISLIAGILVIFGLTRTFAYERPKSLIEETGVISEFKQHDETWLEFFLPYGKGDFFNVRFEDGSLFEATAVPYSMIDSALFEELSIGEEIKIVRSGGSWRPNKIYAIEYRGIEYLSLDDVLKTLEEKARIWHIVGPIVTGVALIAGGSGLIIVNFRARKTKEQKKFL